MTPPDDAIELTIVMPCLNEAETLETCLRKAFAFLDKHGVRGEVVVGDNGSTDGSQDIARRMGARVIDIPRRGYGAALDGAIREARGRYVVMGDSDDSYDFTSLQPFLEQLRGGADLVMGNRFLGGIRPGAMPWKNRYIGNPALTGIGRLFFRCPAGDFHCGLRGFSADAYRRMDLRTTGMEYASEMVIKATLLGQKIVEVPTTLDPDGRSRPPHLRPWRDGWRHLRFMLLYAPSWLFVIPGWVLLIAGLLVMAWLIPGPRTLGGVVLDVHTLLYAAAAALVGFQSVAFGTLATTFAVSRGLLPKTGWAGRLLKHGALEYGLFVGVGLIALGFAGALVSVGVWRAESFGELEPQRVLRLAIPSVLGLTLGAQMILASFFFGILQMHLRNEAS